MTPQAILEKYGPREAMEYDVLVIGAGPGGLATAMPYDFEALPGSSLWRKTTSPSFSLAVIW